MIWPFKRKKKPAPEPWNGIHSLKYVLFEEFFGSSPDDYRTGWIWKCTCGAGTPNRFHYAYTESQAVDKFVEHFWVHEKASLNCGDLITDG